MQEEQFSENSALLETWYRGERGRYALARLQARLNRSLETAFGYHILQTGPLDSGPLFGECRIRHRIYTSSAPREGINLRCERDELPLECDSVDVIIAHHALEFSPNPHQVLRELQRVLTPQGHLFLIGNNPYSPSGLGTLLRGLLPNSPWRSQKAVGLRRLVDWLNLLGCELESAEHLYHLPPIGNGWLQAKLQQADDWCGEHNLPLGGLYLVHAIKQVAANQRPRRVRRRERFIGLSVPSPVTGPGTAPGLPQTGTPTARDSSGPVLH